jgi:hypothetical protein
MQHDNWSLIVFRQIRKNGAEPISETGKSKNPFNGS